LSLLYVDSANKHDYCEGEGGGDFSERFRGCVVLDEVFSVG